MGGKVGAGDTDLCALPDGRGTYSKIVAKNTYRDLTRF